jgi:hypothetical protein
MTDHDAASKVLLVDDYTVARAGPRLVQLKAEGEIVVLAWLRCHALKPVD